MKGEVGASREDGSDGISHTQSFSGRSKLFQEGNSELSVGNVSLEVLCGMWRKGPLGMDSRASTAEPFCPLSSSRRPCHLELCSAPDPSLILPVHLCTPSDYLGAWHLRGHSRNAC